MKRMELDELARMVLPFLRAKGYLTGEPTERELELLKKAVQSLRERAKTLVEMADLMEFYFLHEIVYEEKASEKFLKKEILPVFEEIIQSLSMVEHFDKEGCHRLIQDFGGASRRALGQDRTASSGGLDRERP